MKLRDRDKKLLLVLLVLAVFCIPWFLVIRPMWEENASLQKEILEVGERIRYLSGLSGQERYYEEEGQKLAAEREALLARFPEELPQEETLLFLSGLENRYSIQLMQVTYGRELAAGVTGASGEAGNAESAAEPTASQKEEERLEATLAGPGNTADSSAGEMQQTVLAENMTGLSVSSEYTYSVDYTNWKEFLYAIRQNQDRTVITSLDAKFIENGMVEGSFKMTQYAVNGAGRKTKQVRMPEMTYGTTNIFRQAAGKGGAEETADFFLMLSPPGADVESRIFGRSDDASEASYLRSKEPDRQEVNITFRGENGSYTAFCEIGDVTYEEGGISFAKDGMINLEILSTPRLGTEDTAVTVLHLNNETDTTLGVTILDDDVEEPRVDIRTKLGAILMKETMQ